MAPTSGRTSTGVPSLSAKSSSSRRARARMVPHLWYMIHLRLTTFFRRGDAVTHSPRIAIVGAGLAGLCLAQGLRQAGLNAAVFERDASAASRAQGYRISIDS